MAVRDDLIETFNTCIDRLNQGEAVEDILQDYPTFANTLRPMMEAGSLYRRARIPMTDVEAAQSAGEVIVRTAIQKEFRGGPGIIRWLLVIFILIVGSAAAIITNLDGESTVSVTVTATVTPSVTSTSLMRPSETSTPSTTPQASLGQGTATPLAVSSMVIEGPVRSIDGQTITIFDFVLTLESDDPIIAIVLPGDILRVEAVRSETILQVVSVVFVDVLVLIEDGQVWRGDDCSVPPPDWARGQADTWFIQCLPSNGNSGESDDDDD